MSRPIIAIVGRPNVGKSALFNRIIGERKAIVEATPGVTRDRIYGQFDWRRNEYILVDTGGIVTDTEDPIALQARRQAEIAMQEADLVLFVVDSKEGLTPLDEELADILRKSQRPVLLVVNKVEGKREINLVEFYRLGLGDPLPVSALQGDGVGDLLDRIVECLPSAELEEEEEDLIRVAIVGRPNVGKSSLLNAFLGEERAVVSEIPGTTRDAIDTLFLRGDQRFLLIDTAGIRRAGQIQGSLEYYTFLRAQRAIDRCDVALLIIDATEGVTHGDCRVGGMVLDAGKACVVVVNKWDLVKGVQMHHYAEQISSKLDFIGFAPIAFASAKTGRGIPAILDTVESVFNNYTLRIPTPELNRFLQEVFHQHVLVQKGRTLKLRYATMVKVKPPTIVLFVNNAQIVHFSYERYIENRLREQYGFVGTPIRLIFRGPQEREGQGEK